MHHTVEGGKLKMLTQHIPLSTILGSEGNVTTTEMYVYNNTGT